MMFTAATGRNSNLSRKTAVIGGGAAGMMAGIFGAYAGDDITIFEKNQKIWPHEAQVLL